MAFLLVDPFAVIPEYSIDVAPTQLADLGAYRPADIALLSVVTLPAVPTDQPTANLQGPIAINFATRAAKQLVMSETDFGVRCPNRPQATHELTNCAFSVLRRSFSVTEFSYPFSVAVARGYGCGNRVVRFNLKRQAAENCHTSRCAWRA